MRWSDGPARRATGLGCWCRPWHQTAMRLWAGALALALVGCLPDYPWPNWTRLDVGAELGLAAGEGAAGGQADTEADEPPPCRPFRTGELLLNEVVVRPGGLDLDGDGASSGRDELVELVSIADEPAYVDTLRLMYRGEVRGDASSPSCLAPGHALVLVGATTATFAPPPASTLLRLDRTLRLTDSGGDLAVYAASGAAHDDVKVPAAAGAGPHVIARRADGDWTAPWSSHALLAQGLPWSPGRCVDGGAFPHCATEPPALLTRPP